MNETIISPRRQLILDFLFQNPAGRQAIEKKLQEHYPVSKPTLARELRELVKRGLIEVKGSGRSTIYLSLENPLLKFIDRHRYFADPALRVNVKTGFDFSYSLLETDILIRQLKEAEGHPHEEAVMILNHKAAIDYILKHRQEFRRLDLDKVAKLHALLTGGLGISAAYRTHPLAQNQEIVRALKQAVALINAAQEPVFKAFLASFLIAYIQPFADGNKRTGRTLANAILVAYDFYPLSLRDVKEIDYLESMLLFYEQNNLYHLKQMFVEQLEFSAQNYFRTS